VIIAPAPPPEVDRSAAAPPPPVDVGWADLTQVALLGTSRRAVPAGVRSGRVGLPDGPDEEVVLGAAAASATWRASGPKLADRPDIDMVPAGDDPRPAAPASAAQLLRMALDGGSHVGGGDALVLQWLERAAAAGYRVGHGELVAVLTWATAAKERRPAARAAIGARGAWLASGQPSWAWAAGADEGAVPAEDRATAVARFRDGRKDERADLLRQVRVLDPDLGRQLLDEARATDAAPARLALVEAMATGLSMADEPLLEAMLDDRAKTVRSAVAELLSRLPDSRYAQRMAGRLVPLVQSSRRSISVDLPMSFDDQAAGDAIDTGDGPGKRAEARRSIVVGTPLSFWSQLADPATVVARADKELCADLAEAAARQADARWAAALIDRLPSFALMSLWAHADPAGAMAGAADLLRRAPQAQALYAAVSLVSAVPGPWTLALSREVVGAAHRDARGWSLDPLVSLGSRLDGGVLPLLDAWLEELRQAENQSGLKAVRSLRHSIDLRAAIDASMPLADTTTPTRSHPR
jgi:hypothetical protein